MFEHVFIERPLRGRSMVARTSYLAFCFVANSNGARAPFNRGAPAPLWLGQIVHVKLAVLQAMVMVVLRSLSIEDGGGFV